MPIVVAECVAPVASWRAPEAMTYHRTYPLPPHTTLVGLLGAAAGLPFADAFAFVADHGLELGVGGGAGGVAKDLWKFQKLELVDKAKPPFRDVLLREWRTDVRLALVVACPDAAVADQIAGFFRAPRFPLTAGPSDLLMHARAVWVADAAAVETETPHHVVVPREVTPDYEAVGDPMNLPLTHTVTAPTVERVTTGYRFDPDEPDRRSLGGRAAVTFVADPVRLRGETVTGYRVEPRSSPLRSYLAASPNSEGLPWVIPVAAY